MKRACFAAFVALCVFAPNAFGKGFCTDDGTCFKNDPEFFKHYTTCMSRKRAFTLAARAKKRPKDLSKNANSNSKATNAALSSLMIKDLLNFNALAF